MKVLIAIITLLLLTSQPVLSAEIWGGKWDNRWLVFFIIQESNDQTKVIYKWEERRGQSLSKNELSARRDGPALRVGSSMTLRLTGKSGYAYGDFARPRVAHLVKLDDDTDIRKLNEASITTAGWQSKPIDKEAVKKKVFSGTSSE